ncbi:MAG: hypothetical protein H6822_06790 [Planctomycetaceae bacterium]|nr:hypothetical protein [Planctomycetales bacterium]MCB9921868.1 hypothetical protein [Planctomycetaceae bacterium]
MLRNKLGATDIWSIVATPRKLPWRWSKLPPAFTNQQRLVIGITLLLVLSPAVPSWGVIVLLKNQDEPVRGTLVHEDGVHVEVHESLPNGDIRKHVFPRVSIEDMIRAVDTERLAALNPDSPADYRSYAEELAGKTEDPEARVAAIRLYLIAAYLQPNDLGRSCLLGMAGLARSPEEERAFRAMAFSLDPGHDTSLLKTPTATVAEFAGITDADRAALRTTLQLLRSGKLVEARRFTQRPPVQAAANYYSHIVADSDYKEAFDLAGRLSPRLLRKFLTLELLLSAASTNGRNEEDETYVPWSQLIARDDTQPTTPQSLTTVTEFDPRQSTYRDGKWIVPEK